MKAKMPPDLPGPPFKTLQALAFARSPYTYLNRIHQRYGDPFVIHLPLKTVLTADPEGIRQLFTASYHTFEVKLPKGVLRVLGEKDLRALGGVEHQQCRKNLAPGFHGNHLSDLGSMIHERTIATLDAWPIGEVRDILDTMQDLSLDLILKTVFGVDEEKDLIPLRAAVVNLAAAFGSRPFILSVALGIDDDRWPPNRLIDQSRKSLTGLLLEHIAERRKSSEPRRDILGRLMQAQLSDGRPYDDARLMDSLITNLVAGRAGTSTLMAWMFAWLGRFPEIHARLQDEIHGLHQDDDIDAVRALPFLDACLKESLRLYPQLPVITRTLAQPLELKGHVLPPGINVGACAAALHMNPELYPSPEQFRPDRFLERKYTGFEMIPFGGGYKICLGNEYALLQVKVILTVLLRRARFAFLDRGPLKIQTRGLLFSPAKVRVRRLGF